MSEQLWSDDRVMARYRDFIECNGAEYANIAWQSVILELRDDYQQRIEELERMVSLEMTQATRIGELEAENAKLRAALRMAREIEYWDTH